MEAKRETKFTITPLNSLNASVEEKPHMEELKILELQQQHEHDEDKLSMLIDEMTSKFRIHMKLLEQGMVTHEKEMERKFMTCTKRTKLIKTTLRSWKMR